MTKSNNTKTIEKITCDVSNLHGYLEATGETLMNYNATRTSYDNTDYFYCDIIRFESELPIIMDGEEHSFEQNEDGTWSNIPTEDTGNHEVRLTQEQFDYLSGRQIYQFPID